MRIMRFSIALLAGLALVNCRTTKNEDERFFANGKPSNGAVTGVKVNPRPSPPPGEPLPPLIPNPSDPLENGAFYRLCEARDQLDSREALTIQALLAAVHQQSCSEGERWLRDTRNASLMIESEDLVEVQSLALLQSYPHIRNVYVRLAKGVEPLCPLALPQVCHFREPEF